MIQYLLSLLNGAVNFLVCIIIGPPLGLIITEFTLENNFTVLCCYVSLKMTLLCSLIITVITRILDTFMYRSVMFHHITLPIKLFSTFWTLRRLSITWYLAPRLSLSDMILWCLFWFMFFSFFIFTFSNGFLRNYFGGNN